MADARCDTVTTLEFVALLRRHRRLSVRRLQEDLGLSRRAVYRLVAHASCRLPIRLQGGVVVCGDDLLEARAQ